jgi:hypothetical protein
MTTDWTPLRKELAIWRAEGLTLPLWWRDDDAVTATAALDRLVALSGDMGLPVHIAVIPKHADASLVSAVEDHPNRLISLVHGWAHENHAPEGQKKAEFGVRDARSLEDAKNGVTRLSTLFGPKLVQCFVPPWNRMDVALAPDLSAMGYHTVSTYGPRAADFASQGLKQINTHIDPINWRGDRSAVPGDQLVDGLVKTLVDRRMGRTDGTEPLGVLTHHLVHDAPIWDITKALLSELLSGPVDLYTMTPQEDL